MCGKISYNLGWRRHMEDALIAKCPTHDGSEVSLFAVFDGHGGIAYKYLRS